MATTKMEMLQEVSATVEQLVSQVGELAKEFTAPAATDRIEAMSAAVDVLKNEVQGLVPLAE